MTGGNLNSIAVILLGIAFIIHIVWHIMELP